MPEEKIIRSPDCISEDGTHDLVYLEDDNFFYAECENCFERFVLLSETVLKELSPGLIIHTKDGR